ncbi:MAG: hypothetical protein R2716_11765 [Microthrixaceae bacterium]
MKAADQLDEARRRATETVESATAEAERIREDAREKGRSMVAEARELRNQMLHDIAERSRAGRQKVEAAQAAREVVLSAIRAVGTDIERAVSDLADNDRDMRRAADAAAAAVPDDVSLQVAELTERLEPAEGHPEPTEEIDGAAAAGTATEESTAEEGTAEEGTAEEVGLEAAAVHLDVVEAAVVEADAVEAEAPAAGPAAGSGVPATGTGSPARTRRWHRCTTSSRSCVPITLSVVRDLPLRRRRSLDRLDSRGCRHRGAGRFRRCGPGRVAPDEQQQTREAEHDAPAEDAEDTEEEPLGLLDRRDQLLEPAGKLLGRNLKRLLSDEQNEVLDGACRQRRSRIDVADLLGESDDVERFTAGLSKGYLMAAAAGARMWGELAEGVERAEEPTEPQVAQQLALQVGSCSNCAGPTCARPSRRTPRRAATVPSSSTGCGRPTGTCAPAPWTTWRATWPPGIALGTYACRGPMRAGAGWSTTAGSPAPTPRTTPSRGPSPAGSRFPTGDTMPPAHPGCRCLLVPADTAADTEQV